MTRALAVAFLLAAGTAAAAAPPVEKGRPAVPAAAPAGTAATVDGAPITDADIERLAGSRLTQLHAQEYQLRRQALEELIARRLLEKEAAARQVSQEELVKAEITGKITPVTNDEVKDFYTANQARLGGMPEADAMTRIRDFLNGQRERERRTAFVAELRAKAGVKILLDPPRLAVSEDDDPAQGPAKAPITIVEFSDYQCPYCSRAEMSVKQVQQRYGDRIRLVYRDLPLPIHANAAKAAEAATCAGAQGKYWEMHDALFAHQDQLDVPNLKKRAGELGLDQAAFDKCLDSGQFTEEWKKDADAAEELGISGTPAFLINGRLLTGARPAEEFEQVIDEELERAGLPVPPRPAAPEAAKPAAQAPATPPPAAQ